MVLFDNQSFPYYYNPSSKDMSWKSPSDLAMCHETITYDWWKCHPQPFGPCINFATRGRVNGRLICDACLDRAPARAMYIKNIHGKLAGSAYL